MNLAQGQAFQQRGVCSIIVLTELCTHNHAQHINYIIASLYVTGFMKTVLIGTTNEIQFIADC